MAYISPLTLSTETNPPLPSGDFTVPVCTNAERYKAITDALWGAYLMNEDPSSYEHLIDWLNAIPHIVDGCATLQQSCRKFALTDERVTWYPENPFDQGEGIPGGYPAHPFTVVPVGGLENMIARFGLGYQVGDVFVDILKLPAFTSWEQIGQNYGNMPRMIIAPLNGQGTVKLHVLSLPLGGRLLIVKDGVIDLFDLQSIEVNRELSFPPESVVETVVEVKFDTDEEHLVEFVWYPTISGDFIPFAFGGGVRSFELCGFGVAESDCDCMAENCCTETNILLTKSNKTLTAILNLLNDGFKIVPLSDGKDFFPLGCAPDNFDVDSGDTGDDIQKRLDALCFVVDWYVKLLFFNALDEAGLPGVDVYLGQMLDAPPALWKVKAYPASVVDLFGFMVDLFTQGQMSSIIICEMLSNLQSKMNAFQVFAKSVEPSEDLNPTITAARNLVYHANQSKDNYTLFNTALEQAMGMDISGFTCPCVEVVPPIAEDCSDISLVDDDFNSQIEYIGGCIWKFTQPALNTQGRRYFAIRDTNGENLKFSVAGEPYAEPSIGGCTVTYDCGIPQYLGDNYGGGFLPGDHIQNVEFWVGESQPAVVYFKVELASVCP